jgi:hypothetical protein
MLLRIDQLTRGSGGFGRNQVRDVELAGTLRVVVSAPPPP